MPQITIDRRSVAALPRVDRTTAFYDFRLTGFGIRVGASGAATYFVEYRPGQGGRSVNKKRISIGRDSPAFRADAARTKATALLHQIALGDDPGLARAVRRQAVTVAELLDAYVSERIAVTRKPATLILFEGHVRNWLKPELGNRIAVDLTKADVARLHRTIGATKKVTANRLVELVRAAFTYGAEHGLLPEEHRNPAKGVDRFVEHGRERFLSTDELATLGRSIALAESEGLPWTVDPTKRSKHVPKANQATKVDPFAAAAIKLLILTGARLREILHLEWSSVDLERGLLRLKDSKTGPKVILLAPAAVSIIEQLPRVGRYVIAGRQTTDETGRAVYLARHDLKKPWAAMTKHADLDGVRLHDLRHTYASFAASSGMGLQVVGRLLGHSNPATTARYSHFADDPLRRASDAISQVINASLNTTTSL